jgi:drug/metabolite transporter (DMT)-like permease
MDQPIRKAIGYMLLSTAAFAVMNAFLRRLNHLPALELVFFRALGSAAIASTFLIRKKIPLLGNHKGLLLLRAVLGICAMSLFFTSLKYLPLGIAVSLRYTAPIFGVILAWFLLKERIGPWQALCLLLAFLGVLIIRGFSKDLNPTGLILILSAALFSGTVYITLRKIGTREHPVVVVNYFMVLATITGLIYTLFNWVPPESGWEIVLLFALGLFGYFGQFYMTKAFQAGQTHQIAPFKYAEVVFGLLTGLAVFGESYSGWSFAGMALIIIGLSCYALIKGR